MHAQSRTRVLKQACTALALLLALTSAAASARPARRSSVQTITLYTTGVASPKTTARHPVFTDQGPIGRHGGWLRALTRPADALRPGAVTVVDERLRGSKEFGLPLDGRLQGVLVTSVADNGSHMVALKASFEGDGVDDSIRLFGVRRDDDEESHIAVVGGTGRYSGASGFAVVRVAGVPETGGNNVSLSFSVHLK